MKMMKQEILVNPTQSEKSDDSSTNASEVKCDICDFKTELKDLRVQKEKKH